MFRQNYSISIQFLSSSVIRRISVSPEVVDCEKWFWAFIRKLLGYLVVDNHCSWLWQNRCRKARLEFWGGGIYTLCVYFLFSFALVLLLNLLIVSPCSQSLLKTLVLSQLSGKTSRKFTSNDHSRHYIGNKSPSYLATCVIISFRFMQKSNNSTRTEWVAGFVYWTKIRV